MATLVEVTINGTLVVERRDFIDAGSDVVEKPLSLSDLNRVDLEMQADNDGLVTITIFGPDDDPPTIFAVVTPPPNANGWHHTPPTVSFVCDDATSGIAVCPAAILVDDEVTGRLITGQAVDLAGNTATASAVVNLDMTQPVVNISSPVQSSPPVTVTSPTLDVTGTVTEARSGLASVRCNGTPASLNGSGFTCAGSDHAAQG